MTENLIVRNVNKPASEKLDIATFDKESSNVIRRTLAENNIRVLVREFDRAAALDADPTENFEIFRGLDPEMLPLVVESLKDVHAPIEITRGDEIVF